VCDSAEPVTKAHRERRWRTRRRRRRKGPWLAVEYRN